MTERAEDPLERPAIAAVLERVARLDAAQIYALAAGQRPIIVMDPPDPERRAIEDKVMRYERRHRSAAAMRILRTAAGGSVEGAVSRARLAERMADGGPIVAASEAVGDAVCSLWLGRRLSRDERRSYAKVWRSVAGDDGFR